MAKERAKGSFPSLILSIRLGRGPSYSTMRFAAQQRMRVPTQFSEVEEGPRQREILGEAEVEAEQGMMGGKGPNGYREPDRGQGSGRAKGGQECHRGFRRAPGTNGG